MLLSATSLEQQICEMVKRRSANSEVPGSNPADAMLQCVASDSGVLNP